MDGRHYWERGRCSRQAARDRWSAPIACSANRAQGATKAASAEWNGPASAPTPNTKGSRVLGGNCERAERPIPKGEGKAEILVEMRGIGRMVDLMMGGTLQEAPSDPGEGDHMCIAR
jgi:hypothetical protein